MPLATAATGIGKQVVTGPADRVPAGLGGSDRPDLRCSVVAEFDRAASGEMDSTVELGDVRG